jgi:hypothetical protein
MFVPGTKRTNRAGLAMSVDRGVTSGVKLIKNQRFEIIEAAG